MKFRDRWRRAQRTYKIVAPEGAKPPFVFSPVEVMLSTEMSLEAKGLLMVIAAKNPSRDVPMRNDDLVPYIGNRDVFQLCQLLEELKQVGFGDYNLNVEFVDDEPEDPEP